jgi:hypothetical protein
MSDRDAPASAAFQGRRSHMRHARSITSVAVVGALLALSLVTPVGAHVGGTVGHLWRDR